MQQIPCSIDLIWNTRMSSDKRQKVVCCVKRLRHAWAADVRIIYVQIDLHTNDLQLQARLHVVTIVGDECSSAYILVETAGRHDGVDLPNTIVFP